MCKKKRKETQKLNTQKSFLKTHFVQRTKHQLRLITNKTDDFRFKGNWVALPADDNKLKIDEIDKKKTKTEKHKNFFETIKS